MTAIVARKRAVMRVSSDDDLGRLVEQVQGMIMKELGVEKITPRQPHALLPTKIIGEDSGDLH